ncbi:AI-2E family transporter [Mucilaginibacter mali]|uniref:AI-2E family transporter n=1 Tax=Mucilaginibacter mali TaxID=2740462 RepID=A0A7D4UA85_9SPHI|nr:AI-2E family transporter [Mucilaginibacter mali]QKJ29718.1 AI-2E family transporter [Mucilaginibacter mali]
MTTKKLIAPFYERLSLVLIGILSLGYLIYAGKEVLDPMMFGFLFAILLLPVSSFFERKLRMPRSMASFLSVILMVLFITGIVYLVGTQLSQLSNDWPLLQKQLASAVDKIQAFIRDKFHYSRTKQTNYLRDNTKDLVASGADILTSTFGAVSSLLLFYVFIIIFTFFVLFYRRLLIRFLVWVFGHDNEALVFDIAENVQKIIRQYISGLLIEMLIVSIVACVVFELLGVHYAILLGIITGLFNIIPYIGIFSALLLSSLITFATGDATNTLFVAISVLGIHIVDSNFLLPAVVGKKVQLNALITFIGIVIGEMLWGLSGMFLSIPTIAILKIIFDRIESLKPWGFLLGGEYEYKKSAEKAMKTE